MNKIGRLLRSTSQSFVFGANIPREQVPAFGSFVKAPFPNGGGEVLGVVYDLVILDNDFLRRLALAETQLSEEVLLDQRQTQLPIEVSVLTVGYIHNEKVRCGLPPQPPISLDFIDLCAQEEATALCDSPDLWRILLQSRQLTSDELLLTVVRNQCEQLPADRRYPFLRGIAQALTRYLGNDFQRLDILLGRLEEFA